jgi:hypothetical protein
MMSCRYNDLVYALTGYEKTGVQLIGWDGHQLFPSGISDDVGLYYFVPKLVRLLHCSLDQAIDLFFYGMMGCALAVGIIGFFFLTRSWISRFFATSYIALFSYYVSLYDRMTDNYIVFAALVVAVVPWVLYFMRRKKADYKAAFFCGIVGLVAGYVHYIRSYSSGGVVLFLLLSIIFMSVVWWRRVFLLMMFMVGLLVPFVHMHAVLEARKQYIGPSYQQFDANHVIWHSVYAGFGFLNNNLGIKWDDATVVEHAHKIAPQVIYPSAPYEAVVKGMVFDLIKKHPQFVLQTWFAKFGVMLYYLLFFANIGLLLAFLYRKPWQIDFMFFIALAFNSIFGFIALPGKYYLLGMLAFAVLYCIVSVDWALRQGLLRDLWGRKKS